MASATAHFLSSLVSLFPLGFDVSRISHCYCPSGITAFILQDGYRFPIFFGETNLDMMSSSNSGDLLILLALRTFVELSDSTTVMDPGFQ